MPAAPSSAENSPSAQQANEIHQVQPEQNPPQGIRDKIQQAAKLIQRIRGKSPKEGLQVIADTAPEAEKNEDQQYLEAARATGDFYVSYVQSLIGKGEVEQQLLERLPENIRTKLESIQGSVKNNTAEQSRAFKEQNMDTRSLLRQVYPQEQFEMLDDTSKYRLEEVSAGVFCIFMDSEIFRKIRPGAQAVAVSPRGGISFVIVQEMKPSDQELNLRENLPHEVHHVGWKFAQRDGVLASSEQNKVMQDGFLMYQNELIARMCSDGALFGYSHLTLLQEPARSQLMQEKPEIAEELIDKTGALNDFLRAFREELNESEVKKSDLILPVLEATSYDELLVGLTKMRKIATDNPKMQITSDQEKSSL